MRFCEYIWLDGAAPTQELRSKTRVVDIPASRAPELSSFPAWSFDGSSTQQSGGGDSDLLLEPVNFVRDPLRADGYLVLCEVLNADRTPHVTNARAALEKLLADGAGRLEPWLGFEQEYTLIEDGRPLGFPRDGFPEPQGPYYCGVGAGRAFGRPIVEAHAQACLDAGLMIYGINAEVMPGQWEFQIGYRGADGESADPLTVSDHLWLARWLLQRIAESRGVSVSFDVKPVKGDWNGAGNHTNFSTKSMRAPGTGLAAIQAAVRRLAEQHDEHIEVYGAGLSERLTGLHETCAIDVFRGGIADRGASVRIPRQVHAAGCGYLEDRRPGANCDPYKVCARIIATVCGDVQESGQRRRPSRVA